MWNNPIDDTSTYTSCTNYSKEAVNIIATLFHDLLSYFLLLSFISVFKTGHQSVSLVETVWLNSCSVTFVHQCEKYTCRTSFKLFFCWLHKGRWNKLLKVKHCSSKITGLLRRAKWLKQKLMPRQSAVLAKSRNAWVLPVSSCPKSGLTLLVSSKSKQFSLCGAAISLEKGLLAMTDTAGCYLCRMGC